MGGFPAGYLTRKCTDDLMFMHGGRFTPTRSRGEGSAKGGGKGRERSDKKRLMYNANETNL